MAEVDWKQGLPPGLLSAVAGGRDEIKAMRAVCHSWQQEFEDSVSNIDRKEGPLLPSLDDLSKRFPGLTSLHLFRHEVGQASLGSLSGLRKLATLVLLVCDSEFETETEPQTPLANWWSEIDLEPLRNVPALRDLCMNSHRISAVQCLQGLQLKSLRMDWCTLLKDLVGLEVLPLTRLRLGEAPLLTNAGLGSLRGMALTDLELDSCPRVTDAGLEVFRGMALTRLAINWCPHLTEAGLEVFHGMPLRCLTLILCNGFMPAACARLLQGCSSMTTLDLRSCGPGELDVCLVVSG